MPKQKKRTPVKYTDAEMKQLVCQANLKEFDDTASGYDEEHLFPAQQRTFSQNISTILSKIGKKNPVILDIGCGTGVLTTHIFEETDTAKIFCLDISQNMLNTLKKKLGKKNLQRATFVCEDAFTYLNTTKQKFDIIMVHGAFHHIYDYLAVFEAGLKKLNKGGYYYIAGEPLPRENYNYYLDQTFRIWDRAFLEHKNMPLKKMLFLLYAPFNFLAPIMNSNLIRPIKSKILHGTVNEKPSMELVEYWGYEKGLDLQAIQKTLRSHDMETIKLAISPSFNIELFWKLEKFFNIRSFFDLLAIKR